MGLAHRGQDQPVQLTAGLARGCPNVPTLRPPGHAHGGRTREAVPVTRRPPACEMSTAIIVVYAFHGALGFPSVFYLCEPCADHLCTRLEDRSWPGAEGIAYLALVTPGEDGRRECDTHRRGWGWPRFGSP